MISQRIDMMDDAGVERRVLSPGSTAPYATESQLTVEAAQLLNNSYCKLTSAYPGRFSSLVSCEAFGADHLVPGSDFPHYCWSIPNVPAAQYESLIHGLACSPLIAELVSDRQCVTPPVLFGTGGVFMRSRPDVAVIREGDYGQALVGRAHPAEVIPAQWLTSAERIRAKRGGTARDSPEWRVADSPPLES